MSIEFPSFQESDAFSRYKYTFFIKTTVCSPNSDNILSYTTYTMTWWTDFSCIVECFFFLWMSFTRRIIIVLQTLHTNSTSKRITHIVHTEIGIIRVVNRCSQTVQFHFLMVSETLKQWNGATLDHRNR